MNLPADTEEDALANTTGGTAQYCISGGLNQKKQMWRKRDAQEFINKSWKHGRFLRVYHCDLCNYWHLTSKVFDKGR